MYVHDLGGKWRLRHDLNALGPQGPSYKKSTLGAARKWRPRHDLNVRPAV